MAKTYYDQDVNWEIMNGKTVAIIGYGSQGHAHALNLKESGVNVVVGLYEGSKSKAEAEKHGLKVLSVADAVKSADITMILIPDEKQADVYKNEIAPNLKSGSALAFAHGFNIHFKQIVPPADVDVFMVAPKGPGHLVRRTFVEGGGVPDVFAVEQDATGKCFDVALAYARGIGGTRAGVIQTTFKEETEETEQKKADSEKLVSLFRKVLDDEELDVRVESLKDPSVASLMTMSEDGRRMQEMMKMYGLSETELPTDETLILNSGNELVQYLMAHPKSKNAALIAEQLYDLALLGHKTLTPEEMTRFVANAQALMQQLIK